MYIMLKIISFSTRRFTYLLLLLGALHLYPCAAAESLPYSLSHRAVQFSDLEGLSQNSVLWIHQDSRGFMWFATQDGLNRWDGYRFKVYTHDPDTPNGLPSSYIRYIYESPRYPGTLWVITNSGVCTYNFDTETFTPGFGGPDFPSLPHKYMLRVLLDDPEGNIWVGSDGGGLFYYCRELKKWTQYRNREGRPAILSHNSVFHLALDGGGNLWIGSRGGGLSRWGKQTGEFSIFHQGKPDGPLWRGRPVTGLLCDEGGRLWIATVNAGLWALDIANHPESAPVRLTNVTPAGGTVESNNVLALCLNAAGRVWSSGNGGGLFLSKKKPSEQKPARRVQYRVTHQGRDALSNAQVMVLFRDRAGSLWIGTLSAGAFRIDPRYREFHGYSHLFSRGLKHNEIWGMEESKSATGSFWIGTEGGLYRFFAAEERFQHIPHDPRYPNRLTHQRVLAVHEDSKGSLWLGTDGGGIYRRDKNAGGFRHYTAEPGKPGGLSGNRTFFIREDSRGALWFALQAAGLCRLTAENRDSGYFTCYRHHENNPSGLPVKTVNTLLAETDALWVGTHGGGILRFDLESESFSRPPLKNTPPVITGAVVLGLHRDGEGLLWAGTYSGLFSFDTAAGMFRHYTVKDGLPNNTVYGILEEDPPRAGCGGDLWFNTNKGLSRFTRAEGRFTNFDRHDGLLSNEFNAYAYTRGTGGIMLFGGTNGLNLFEPGKIRDNPHIPPVFITGFQVHYRPVPIRPGGGSPLTRSITHTKELRLDYRSHTFSFEFAALDYLNPAGNSYAYMLDGYDEDWVHLAERRTVNYTRVPPGQYVFRVKAANSDGAWNETGATVGIRIAPPFHGTPWFRGLVLLLVLGLLALLHKFRTGRITQRLEKQRLEKELKLKADFTAMLVHDLRSPLSSIIGYAEMIRDIPGKTGNARSGAMIARNSEHMMHLINDMLDLSKFEAGKMQLNRQKKNLVEIAEECIDLMQPLYERKEISLHRHFEGEIKNRSMGIDGGKIAEVINNLLGNAVKFTPERGSIIMTCGLLEPGVCEFCVTDNGPGIPKEKQNFLFDKYAQLKMENKEKGTGLGLAISRLIIEAHGGAIGFRPGPMSKGSTFFFRLPLEP